MHASKHHEHERATGVEIVEGDLVVKLADGCVMKVPVDKYPRLARASAEDRRDYRLIGGGVGIHWTRLDEDLSIAGLVRDLM